MNERTETLLKEIKTYERNFLPIAEKDKWRLGFHLMPPIGWMNDPNGLCFFHGNYHVFFQHSPINPEGGNKCWGHYISPDLLHWEYLGDAILPDEAFDRNGVFSGSSLIWEDRMYVFYTGNVEKYGDSGSLGIIGCDVVLMQSDDGITFGPKKVVIETEDFPDDMSMDIRDPKVWREGNGFYMVLGGRSAEDTGVALLYYSENLIDWEYKKMIQTYEKVGYVWECPDYFRLDGVMGDKEKHCYLLSVSPQGLERQAFRFQNIFQSGFFLLEHNLIRKGDKCGKSELDFHEWDKGFDFYAPQTFQDEKGRRILYGWAGISGEPYFNPTVSNGWQNALTCPREITYVDGMIRMNPVEEMEQLRSRKLTLENENTVIFETGMGELILTPKDGEPEMEDFSVRIADALVLSYRDMIFSMGFEDSMGCGRTKRKEVIGSIRNIRLLLDTSMIEVFINDGEQVFTTRFYPEEIGYAAVFSGMPCAISAWELRKMDVDYHIEV